MLPADSLLLTFFFFNDTATTEIYTLSLHDALPILIDARRMEVYAAIYDRALNTVRDIAADIVDENSYAEFLDRSEEHTSELQSRQYLVCRLLLEKKNRNLRSDQLEWTRTNCRNL